jgi:putative SOS response-associated peptidase YedK
MAAIYDLWEGDDGSYVPSLGIITTAANNFMRHLHQRMPLILSPDTFDPWLDPSLQDIIALSGLLAEIKDPKLQCHRVSPAVNKAANNSEDLIKEYSFQKDIII